MIMCNHAYVLYYRTYYDKKLKCRVRIERDTCIFCGKKLKERVIWVKDPPKRRLPKFKY